MDMTGHLKEQQIPLFLAPMAELSHRALRELIEEFGGCDEYFSEMINAGTLLAEGPFEKWYIDSGPKPEKLVFQVVGSDSGQISRAAALLDRLPCAGIDINMGCSAPIIRKSGAGAAWMADIDRAGKLISRVRAQVKRRLSVKLRLGFQGDFDYLVRFCRRLEAEGTELITLHPRTVMEKFKRRARWELVGALKRELKIPLAGNGDIATAEELAKRAGFLPDKEGLSSDHAGSSVPVCDAVMVGRAAVRQPWIFVRARALPLQESFVPKEAASAALSLQGSSVPNIEETGLRFLELLSRYQPPEFHVSRAKRFFGFFCDNLKWGNYLKNRLNREESLSGIELVWLEYFSEMPAEENFP